MKLTMIKSTPGSPDGKVTIRYEAGTNPEVPDALAKVFIELGVAKEYVPPVELVKHQEKMAEKVENKAFSTAPSNKSGFSKKRK